MARKPRLHLPEVEYSLVWQNWVWFRFSTHLVKQDWTVRWPGNQDIKIGKSLSVFVTPSTDHGTARLTCKMRSFGQKQDSKRSKVGSAKTFLSLSAESVLGPKAQRAKSLRGQSLIASGPDQRQGGGRPTRSGETSLASQKLGHYSMAQVLIRFFRSLLMDRWPPSQIQQINIIWKEILWKKSKWNFSRSRLSCGSLRLTWIWFDCIYSSLC